MGHNYTNHSYMTRRLSKHPQPCARARPHSDLQNRTCVRACARALALVHTYARARAQGMHWSEKTLEQMTERDWRILKEDYGACMMHAHTPVRASVHPCIPPVGTPVHRSVRPCVCASYCARIYARAEISVKGGGGGNIHPIRSWTESGYASKHMRECMRACMCVCA